jgi:hypothetical protein
MPSNEKRFDRAVPLEGVKLIGYTVGAWCPDQAGAMPPQAVGLSLTIELEAGQPHVTATMRMRTPAAVDKLIEQLKRYKSEVWPGPTGKN